jgi:hypothetical protein
MEDLDINLLTIICLYIPSQSIISLLVSTSTLTKKVFKICEDNFFWKRYTEIFLAGGKELATKKHLVNRNVNWRTVHDIINELYVNWEIENMDLLNVTENDTNKIDSIETASLFNNINDLDMSYQNDDILHSIYILIEAGYDPSVNNNCLIKYVSKHKYTEIIETLLKDPRIICSADHNQLLLLAAQNDQVDIFRHMLSDKRTDFWTIMRTIRCSSVNIIKILLEDSKFNIKEHNYEIIESAIRRKKVDIVELLLRDPNFKLSKRKIDSVIYTACSLGSSDIIKLLISSKFDHSNDEIYDIAYAIEKTIIYASKEGCVDIIKFLLEDKKVDFSIKENEPIMLSVEYGHTEVVKL